jgi:23S rRNA (guanosine2251-2'-O)-methyltransferase
VALELRNPHSVLAILEHRPQAVLDVQLSTTHPSPGWDRVATLASQHRIPVRRVAAPSETRRKVRREAASVMGRTGGNLATVKERPAVSLEELFASVDPNAPGLWLALDQIQDPHNVGAIFRTAAFFGVRGIVLTKDRSAPLSATVYDVASGGLECVPFAQPPNLSRSLEQAKTAGVWVLGTSEHAERELSDIDKSRPWLLVLGNEEKGLRRLTSEHCDELCRIAPKGEITSLNVSVAAGVMMAALSDGS